MIVSTFLSRATLCSAIGLMTCATSAEVTSKIKPAPIANAPQVVVPPPAESDEQPHDDAAIVNTSVERAASPDHEDLPIGPLHVFKSADTQVANDADEKNTFGAIDPRKNEIARVLVALGVVLGLIVIARFITMRWGGPLSGGRRPSGVVEVLARYPLARGQQLILLKIARRILVVHQMKTSVTTLSEFTDTNEVASLLSKIDAGAQRKPRTEEFSQTLRSLTVSPQAAGDNKVETIDLTKQSRSPFSQWLFGRRSAA